MTKRPDPAHAARNAIIAADRAERALKAEQVEYLRRFGATIADPRLRDAIDVVCDLAEDALLDEELSGPTEYDEEDS